MDEEEPERTSPLDQGGDDITYYIIRWHLYDERESHRVLPSEASAAEKSPGSIWQ